MDYRHILKNHLIKRQEVNPRYSLRSFALKISLSPSKLSEILSAKKRLSLLRATEIADKLGLTANEKEVFLLSAKLESPAKNIDKVEIKKQLKVVINDINNNRTTQKNAWYFGAIKQLEENGFEGKDYAINLGITELQAENAKRFIKRIKKIHPDRSDFSFEPTSILKKIEEGHFEQESNSIEADFAFLTKSQIQDLQNKVKILVKAAQEKNKNISPEDLCLIHWGTIKLVKE